MTQKTLSELSEEQKANLSKLQKNKPYKKGDILIRENEAITEYYSVIKGCVRSYSLVNGDEITLDFYIEDQTINLAINGESATSHCYLVCEEDCILSVINNEMEKTAFEQHPYLKDICLKNTELLLHQTQKEQLLFKSMSPQERYLHLLTNKPSLIERVPHHQIASYLGIKPESLSRLRKRLKT